MSDQDKSSMSNGGSDPLQRLASFKAPRDLSLGGVKPNKKVFTPNLNVARNKNKGPALVSRDQRKNDKNKKDKKNDRNKNFKNGHNVIKSSGVFSEGLGSIERHSSRASYASRDSEPTAALRKPTIRIKDFVRVDKDLEDQKIRSVTGDTDYNENDSEDFKTIKEKDAPVKLPIDDGCRKSSQSKAVKIKQEVVVKEELLEGQEVDILSVEKPKVPAPRLKEEVFEDTDVVELLRSEEPTLILLQLPDTLPGRGSSADDDIPRQKPNSNAPSTSEDTEEKKPVDNRCHLSDLEEGRIGKLRVHQSGRVTLSLGTTMFEVCSGTKAVYHQEVVCVASDDASRSANLIALGPLQHKLNVVLDWETLFCDMTV